MTPIIRVIVFASPGTIPLEVGRSRGMFAAQGIEVNIEETPSSPYMMSGLIDGRYEMAATAVDNVVAYVEGQGAVATRCPPDIAAFMGYPSYRLPFVVHPDIGGWQNLRGRKIAVDALSTGFAFLLRQMLADNGLEEDDAGFEAVGAPRERWEAVAAGTHAGALLTGQFAALALKKGFHVLASDPDPWDNYQGAVLAARRDWARANASVLKRFIRAVLDAAAWTLDPSNRADLTGIVRRTLPQLDAERAAQMAQDLQSPESIIRPDMPISIRGVRTVLELRSRYGRPQKRLDDPFKYIDLSYYEAVSPKIS